MTATQPAGAAVPCRAGAASSRLCFSALPEAHCLQPVLLLRNLFDIQHCVRDVCSGSFSGAAAKDNAWDDSTVVLDEYTVRSSTIVVLWASSLSTSGGYQHVVPDWASQRNSCSMPTHLLLHYLSRAVSHPSKQIAPQQTAARYRQAAPQELLPFYKWTDGLAHCNGFRLFRWCEGARPGSGRRATTASRAPPPGKPPVSESFS